MPRRALVTGGSGFLGTKLTDKLIAGGWDVTVFDLNLPANNSTRFLRGDIRDFDACQAAVKNVDVVFHNVAQVPLAKDKSLFTSVNIDGAKTILDAAAGSEVSNFVMTSSSAVYGLPKKLPANLYADLVPVEEYGKAKLAGEYQVTEFHRSRMDISIVRPRTILGAGRLGLFSVLFDWISKGLDVFVFGDGHNPYQFIHVDDLAAGLESSSNLNGFNVLNLGARDFGTLRSDLTDLCEYANTGSKIRSIPESLARPPLMIASKLGLIPFASYQLLLYSQAMFFDSSEDWKKLGVTPRKSNQDCLRDSFEWYLANRNCTSNQDELSLHQKPSTGFSLRIMESFLKRL